jgi:inhibitor of cysteine peptidase
MEYSYIVVGFTLIFVGSLALFGAQQNPSADDKDISKFTSEQEFIEFVSQSSSGNSLVGNPSEALQRQTADFSGGAAASADTSVKRSSDTNIQVSGVGEPDILKNTGERIYYSPERDYYWSRPSKTANTSVFDTLPAENFSEVDRIEENGRMFLTNDSIVFLGDNISAYSRDSHEKQWDLNTSASIEAARKIDGDIFLVQRNRIDSSNPCPVKPLESTMLRCTDFYHPPEPGESDTTYTLAKIDAESGEVLEKTGFVGSGSNTIVYMSHDSLYLTYQETVSETEIMIEFLESEGDDLLNSETMDRIGELQSYDLSDQALMMEVRRAIEEYSSSLGEEEKREFQKDMEKAVGNYTKDRKRQLVTTGVAEFDLDLKLESEGEVPGEVNDQFSMSESEGNLRIATTVGNSWQFDTESENDLYVLNDELDEIGSVQGMGLNEQIYSVRYINDKAYVVTFRRIDPFHTIDLSDPGNPEVTGKLKLPGFSSYLHPLGEDRILGIGEENNSVKAVMFDVSGEPEVEDSKILDDWYSSVSDSHHAFQIDRENEVFFLPGSRGGHFFSYSDGLEQVKEVEMQDVKRGAFVNQYFYVFSDYKASVVDMESWDTVKQIRFREKFDPEPVPLPGPVREPVLER